MATGALILAMPTLLAGLQPAPDVALPEQEASARLQTPTVHCPGRGPVVRVAPAVYVLPRPEASAVPQTPALLASRGPARSAPVVELPKPEATSAQQAPALLAGFRHARHAWAAPAVAGAPKLQQQGSAQWAHALNGHRAARVAPVARPPKPEARATKPDVAAEDADGESLSEGIGVARMPASAATKTMVGARASVASNATDATSDVTAHLSKSESERHQGSAAERADQPVVVKQRQVDAEARKGADDLRKAVDSQQVLKAAVLLESSPAAASSEEERSALLDKARGIRHVLETCSPPAAETDGWKRFDLEDGFLLWRRWHLATGELQLVISWEARGGLLQHIASLRDSYVAEPFWDGASWDMQSQHKEGATLASWREKDILTGKKKEIFVERAFCDCLDSDTPCFVMSERSPVVDSLEDFSGTYGPFTIPARDPSYSREVKAESGRIIEPVGADKTRTSVAMRAKVPTAVRWMVTDTLLTSAIKMTAKSQLKSWNYLLDHWDASGFPERIQQEEAFYAPVAERIDSHLRLEAAHPGAGDARLA